MQVLGHAGGPDRERPRTQPGHRIGKDLLQHARRLVQRGGGHHEARGHGEPRTGQRREGGRLPAQPRAILIADVGQVDDQLTGPHTGSRTSIGGSWSHSGSRGPPLAFGDDLRLERGVAVAGHVDLDRPDLGQHGLGAVPVAGVPAVAAGRVVALVAEVVGDLSFQSGLDQAFGELGE